MLTSGKFHGSSRAVFEPNIFERFLSRAIFEPRGSEFSFWLFVAESRLGFVESGPMCDAKMVFEGV